MATEKEKQDRADRVAAVFRAAFDKMGREVRFRDLQRFDSGLFREVVWFQGGGWNLVRSGKGDWAGLPTAAYKHPPLFGRVMRNSRASAIEQALLAQGFFLPSEHPYAQRLDGGLRALGLLPGG